MKKTIKLVFAALLTVSLLVACGGGGDQGGAEEPKFKVVAVLDSGGVDDRSFNQSSWEGVQKFLEDNKLSKDHASYLTSKEDGSDYVSNLDSAALEADLIIAIGFLFEDALKEVAPKHPDTTFLFIDGAIEGIPNLKSTKFADEEGSYYVGLIAGLRAKEAGTNQVGFVGGYESETIGAFQAGYEAGVWETNPDTKISIEYAMSFADTSIGASLASKLYDNGANVIFHAAGDVGNGVITEAKNREDVWVIGVDKDQYAEGLDEKEHSVVLTSMIKKVNTAAYNFLKEYLDKGKIETELFEFYTGNDGIGAEITEDRNLTKEEIELIKEYMEKVKDGSVKVSREPLIPAGKSMTKAEADAQ